MTKELKERERNLAWALVRRKILSEKKEDSRCDRCTVPPEVRRNTHCCERCTPEHSYSENK